MITVSVKAEGLDTLVKQFAAPEKQVRFASMVALNRAAFTAADATKGEMRKVFERPTPWVIGGVQYMKATKDRLVAQVDFNAWKNTAVAVEKVLDAEIKGGNRRGKRFERALQAAGVLPAGMMIVPGSAAQLDSYGNMSPGQISQVLAWFKAFGATGHKANLTAKGKSRLAKDKKSGRGFAYFALQRQRGSLLPGIYQRFQLGHGSAIKPVMIFIRPPRYAKRLDFYGVGEKIARAEFDKEFPKALDEALRTAR